MSTHDFTEISNRYRETSIVQSSAGEMLISLLGIEKNKSILDVGCGSGNLTKRLYEISGGRVVGIDPSEGMIMESKKNYGDLISFYNVNAEDLEFENEFDVIYCNSTFQWFKEVNKIISNFYRALKKSGRVGIQAPGTLSYCPQFLEAVECVKMDKICGPVYGKFNSPWLMLQSADEYTKLFKDEGFSVLFSEIQSTKSTHTPEEVYKIFASGAIAGYLNVKHYESGYDDEYSKRFTEVIKQSFNNQADDNNLINLEFNRIFLIAKK